MEASELQLFYTSSEVSSDGGIIPVRTVTADSTSNLSFSWSDATGIDWTYAIGWFEMNTITPELAGQFFAVRSATESVITVTNPMSGLPVIGDTFILSLVLI